MDEAGASAGRDRTFLFGFVFGWAAYFGISMSFALFLEGLSVGESLSLAAVNTVAPLVTSAIVALNRRRLLRPEWSVSRTLAVHAVVGVTFGACTAGLLMLSLPVTGASMYELDGASVGQKFAAIMLSSIFLYVVFIGFVMWAMSMRRMRESQEIVAREAVLRAEAEAKAVRAQFNPHFVFNTLHSLMLLVRADPDAAERAIEDVATLIRYASIVQRQDIDAVPLAKELEVVRRYTALEALRLQDRLRVDWDVDDAVSGSTIPAFALQTLVENAIKHGIEPVPEGGTVRIAVARNGHDLRITVEDDGAGADPGSVSASPGHALGLLRERLRLRYGEAARLAWTTGPGAGFSVTARFPAESAGIRPELDVIESRPPESAGSPR